MHTYFGSVDSWPLLQTRNDRSVTKCHSWSLLEPTSFNLRIVYLFRHSFFWQSIHMSEPAEQALYFYTRFRSYSLSNSAYAPPCSHLACIYIVFYIPNYRFHRLVLISSQIYFRYQKKCRVIFEGVKLNILNYTSTSISLWCTPLSNLTRTAKLVYKKYRIKWVILTAKPASPISETWGNDFGW